MHVMENEGRSNQRAKHPDFMLQWGSSKKHRCPPKVKNKGDKKRNNDNGNSPASRNSNGGGNIGGDGNKLLSSDSLARRKATSSSGINSRKERSPRRILHRARSLKSFVVPRFPRDRSADSAMNKRKSSQALSEEDRVYTTRGSMGADETGKVLLENNVKNDKGAFVWPKLFLSLSSKEKEEDFMAMKGCKPPQRPKKRAKLIQRSVFLVSPGAWLSDFAQDRYEVKEKKTSKKKPRGLKAMGGMESDSE